jgi:hypothetical protein
MLTVKKLKELLKNVPDNTPVVTSGSDHTYDECRSAWKTTAVEVNGDLSEDYTDSGYKLADYGDGAKVITVLHIS